MLDRTIESQIQERKKGTRPKIFKCNRITIFFLLVILATLGYLLYTFKSTILSHLMKLLIFIERLVKNEMEVSPVNGILMILAIQTLIYQCFLPLVAIYNLLIVYILRDFKLSWVLMFTSMTQ